MFVIKSENKSLFSKLILSESSFAALGVVVLVLLLFLGIMEGENQTTVKTKNVRPAASGMVAKNLKTLG